MINAKKYDYIIAGAGAAGLSLLYRMLHSNSFKDKRFLLIDKNPKTTNDRTWCFWEKENDVFENVVYRKWNHLNFFTDDFKTTLDISPYQYKMIRGIDFYKNAFAFISQYKNVEIVFEEILEIKNSTDGAFVKSSNKIYEAQYVFNSIMKDVHKQKNKFYFLQHFKGFVIETPQPIFLNNEATLMDFRIEQKNDTRFVYTLPFDERTALIEYTVFSEQLLKQVEYTDELKNYLKTFLKCDEYKIIEEEFGVIPMTNARFKMHDKNIINIGTAGGMTKASTGYTFQFIQQQTKQLVQSLIKTGTPSIQKSFLKKRFDYYDTVLLHILLHHQLAGKEIFKIIFQKNNAATVLSFLENKSSIVQELNLFLKLPNKVFTKAALKSL